MRAFDRGALAASSGLSLGANPYAGKKRGSAQRRATQWEAGWHSMGPRMASRRRVRVVRDSGPSMPGDYERRETGLLKLFRPVDGVAWDVCRREMLAGVSDGRGHEVGHRILWHYAQTRGRSIGVIGEECELWAGHPLKYLYSALCLGDVERWPPLVVSAYEELYG